MKQKQKIREDNKSGAENKKEEVQKEAVVKSPTYCDIVKSESGKEVQHKNDLVNTIRPSLPKISKTFYKVIHESSMPGKGRKATRKTTQ